MDDYGLELSGLDPDSIAELRRLRKEQRMAEAMMQQGEQPLRGQMVGGVYVRPSIFQGLAGMANTYAGNKRSQAVDEGYRSLSEKRKAVEAAAFDKFQQGFYGSPEKTEQLPEGMFGPPQTTPAVTPDMNTKQQAIIELLRSQSPTAKMVAPMMNQELNRQREQQEFRDALKGAAGGGQLTGFEPMQNGVPGQQGMVGDPQNLIQDIAMNPDMSNEDKQAAIAQIRQQAAGAGGGQIDPRAMLLSGNPKAMQVGQFLEGQQDKKTLATQRAQDALEKQRQHDQVMASLGGNNLQVEKVIGPDGKPTIVARKDSIGKTPVATDPESQAALFSAKGKAKLSAGLPQARLRTESMKQNLDRLDEAMTALHDNPDLERITGTIAGRTPNLTNAATGAQADLNSIKSQIFQSSLQSMREASKTGGAVGNVSDREGDKLERTLAGLDQSAGTPKFKENLKKAIDQVRLSKQLIQNAFDEQYGDVADKPAGGGTVLRFDAQGNPIP